MNFFIPYVEVSDIPISEYKNLHKVYWRFISDHKLREKPDIYSEISGEYIHIMGNCFACQYAFEKRKKSFLLSMCEICPLKCYRSTNIMECAKKRIIILFFS